MPPLLRTARPRHWLKNVLVFAAPGAAGVLDEPDQLLKTLLAFVAMCLAASGTYFWNDVLDVEADRAHPTKSRRPIAAGEVSLATGRLMGVVLPLLAVAAGAATGEWEVVGIVAAYLAITLTYSAFWKHIGHVVRNAFRALGLSVTRGVFAGSPVGGPTRRYWQKLAWSSASFAFLADVAMGTLGGDLKRKEKLTGRFADIFSWMYLAATTLNRFEADGRPKEDEAFMRWSMDEAFRRIQVAFDGLYANMQVPGATWFFRGPIAAWSRINRLGSAPSDYLGHKVARALQIPGVQRDRMTEGVYVPEDVNEALGRLENAFQLAYASESVMAKIKTAIKRKELPRKVAPQILVEQALEKGIITPDEARLLKDANDARNDAVQVDSFTLEEYMKPAAEMNPVSVDPDPVSSGDGAAGDGAAHVTRPGGTAYGAAVAPAEPRISEA